MLKLKKLLILVTLIVNSSVKKGLAAAELQNPLGQNLSTQTIIGQVINAILGIVGSIALVMFIIGGFWWLTAGGNEERVQKGRKTLEWATFGLIVIFSAYAILRFIFEALTP